MSSKSLRKLVRTATIIVAICGATACFYFLPIIGAHMAVIYPHLAHNYYPWLIFLWITAAPCFAFLVLIWKLSSLMRRELIFTLKTARMVKICAVILFCDIIFFVLGNIVFLILGMNHPVVLLLSVIIAIFVLVITVLVAILSRYLTKAATLQEEVDSTI